MPFTPFHMGAGLIAKPALKRRFSVLTFGIAQLAMDVEPGIRMWADEDVLHGPTHSFLGALVMAVIVAMVAPRICHYLLMKWNKEVVTYGWPWLAHSGPVSKSAVTIGAFFGTLSHVVLDSLMHHDIHPLSPFSTANPFMGLVTNDGVHQGCVTAGVLGIACLLASRYAGRSKVKGDRRHEA